MKEEEQNTAERAMRFLMRFVNGIFVGRGVSRGRLEGVVGRPDLILGRSTRERETGEINLLHRSFLPSAYSIHFLVKASSSRADCGAICEHRAKVASARARLFAHTRLVGTNFCRFLKPLNTLRKSYGLGQGMFPVFHLFEWHTRRAKKCGLLFAQMINVISEKKTKKKITCRLL